MVLNVSNIGGGDKHNIAHFEDKNARDPLDRIDHSNCTKITRREVLARQSLALSYLPQCNFNISATCLKANVSRRLWYHWENTDPDFKEEVRIAFEARLDYWEGFLYRNAQAGSDAAVIFALKCLGKDRGYQEKETNNKKVSKLLLQVRNNELTAREAAFDIQAMGLPLPEILKIELSKAEVQEGDEGDAPSAVDIDRKAAEALAAAYLQRDRFLPERQKEVLELKEEMKHKEQFGPDVE